MARPLFNGRGGSTATLDPLLQIMHGDFWKYFLMIMCAIEKDAHIFSKHHQNRELLHF